MISQLNVSRQVRRTTERKESKALLNEENLKNDLVKRIKNSFSNIFEEKSLEKLAFSKGIIERKRELTAVALVGILMLGCSGPVISSLVSMCSDLRKWFNIHITPQALQKKINNKNTSDFIKIIMNKVMTIEINKILSRLFKRKKRLSSFKRILLQDSTVISLHENLSRIFRGCGGDASKSAVKCDFIIDLVTNQILYMKCLSGRVPDSSLSNQIIKHCHEGDLILRDLGYFNLAHLKQIIMRKSKFVSRLSKKTHVYLKENDEEPVNLPEYLEKNKSIENKIDIILYVGKIERVKVRMIGLKVPQEVLEIRRKQYKKVRKKEPSDSLVEWNHYTFMITNISSEEATLNGILNFYKLRWQIELFFKTLKSILSIDEISGSNKYRILCFLYLKLCMSWISSMLYSLGQAKNTSNKEISLIKFSNWITRIRIFECMFIYDGFEKLLISFERDKSLLYKRKVKETYWSIEIN